MLVPLLQEAQYQSALRRAKTAAGAFSTSLFAGPEAMRRWMEQGRLRLLEAEGAALILRRDRQSMRLFHLARDLATLEKALALLAAEPTGVSVVSDLVGREAEVRVLTGLYSTYGFHSHQRLLRMTAQGVPPAVWTEEGPPVALAAPEQAQEVQAFLEARLDPLAEQLPEPEDMLEACRRGEVFGYWAGSNLAGVLVMAVTGYSTMLRYWFVAERFQGTGVGSRLMSRFFRACAASRRIVLWVIADNAAAQAKYQHYGFKMDGIMDQVMVLTPGEE